MDLYPLFLTLHNLARWLVVIFAILALVRAWRGWLRKGDWTRLDDRAGIFFTSALDTQVLLGLILYFAYSPYAQLTANNFSGAMADPATRFFGLEHWLWMLAATVGAHVGRAVSRRQPDPLKKHRLVAIFFTAAVLLILLAIPWPFLANTGRPLFRLFGITF